jgi:hypothetical protein
LKGNFTNSTDAEQSDGQPLRASLGGRFLKAGGSVTFALGMPQRARPLAGLLFKLSAISGQLSATRARLIADR